MQSKKGLYLLITLIGTILIFFFVLFFVHENTLENGILFTVSFEYENAKDVEYNFYNQNGKIEKVEKENKFLLEKTDYNAVKLLRKVTKKIDETKTPVKEEGITIFNGQNKRYYLIPYDSAAAEELASYIYDGYIREELKKKTGKTLGTEIYFYEENDKVFSTKDGNKDHIIHTYRCSNENCKVISINQSNSEIILWDNEYYYYDYATRLKEKMNVKEDFVSVDFLKLNHKTVGLQLQNNKKENAYYDLEKKEQLTDYETYDYQLVNTNLLLKNKMKKLDDINEYELILWNYSEKRDLWKKMILEKNVVEYSIVLLNEEKNYSLLSKKINGKDEYYLLDETGKELLNGQSVKWTEKNEFVIENKESSQKKYSIYNFNGELIKEADELEG